MYQHTLTARRAARARLYGYPTLPYCVNHHTCKKIPSHRAALLEEAKRGAHFRPTPFASSLLLFHSTFLLISVRAEARITAQKSLSILVRKEVCMLVWSPHTLPPSCVQHAPVSWDAAKSLMRAVLQIKKSIKNHVSDVPEVIIDFCVCIAFEVTLCLSAYIRPLHRFSLQCGLGSLVTLLASKK